MNWYCLLLTFLCSLSTQPRLHLVGERRKTRHGDLRFLEHAPEVFGLSPHLWKMIHLTTSIRLSHEAASFINDFRGLDEGYFVGSHCGLQPLLLSVSPSLEPLVDHLVALIHEYPSCIVLARALLAEAPRPSPSKANHKRPCCSRSAVYGTTFRRPPVDHRSYARQGRGNDVPKVGGQRARSCHHLRHWKSEGGRYRRDVARVYARFQGARRDPADAEQTICQQDESRRVRNCQERRRARPPGPGRRTPRDRGIGSAASPTTTHHSAGLREDAGKQGRVSCRIRVAPKRHHDDPGCFISEDYLASGPGTDVRVRSRR